MNVLDAPVHDRVFVDGNGRFEGRVAAGSYPHLTVQSETQGVPDIERAFTVKPGETTELGDLPVDLR